ncbi:MAG: sugar ABC transporter permease [Caldilineaceae bacterium]|nr:sugar ABC transporter permease [Caldilineaceae bacterium]
MSDVIERGSEMGEERTVMGDWRLALRGVRQDRAGDALMGYLFILPALALYLTFSGYPLIRGLMIAFSDYRYLIPNHQPFNGLANFVEMVQDPLFWASFGRSLYYTLIYTPLNIGLGLLIALLIARITRPFEASIYRVVAYLPVVLPIAVGFLLWKQLLHPQFGYLNYFLREWVGIANPPAWLADLDWVIPTLAVAAVWKHVGQNILLFLVGLYNINGQLYEAAAIDGATGWAQFRHITLPLLSPTTFMLLILSLIGAFQVFEYTYVMTGGGPVYATLTIVLHIYNNAFRSFKMGYASALAYVLFFILLALTLIQLRLQKRWVHYE